MSEERKIRSKPKGEGEKAGARRGASARPAPSEGARRRSRARERDSDSIEPDDLMDPEVTGGEIDAPEEYFQPTAMLDKAELLGELAELQEVPNTRAAIETEQSAPRGCRLIVVAGPDLGKEWSFKKTELVVGRDEDCEIVLSDIAVSRRHARIGLDGSTFFLNDLGSGNGTFLNGVRITQEALTSGDEVAIGERTLRFVELNEAPSTAAAQPVQGSVPKEPRVSSLLKKGASAAKEPALNPSRVKAAVLDRPASQQAPEKDEFSALAAIQERPKRRLATAAVAVVVLLGAGVVYFGQKYMSERAAEARLVASKREFLQGVELVKARRFGDALLLFDRVLVARPDYARAHEYRAYAEAQLHVFERFEAARKLRAAKHPKEALAALEAIQGESAYGEDIERAKSEVQSALARARVEQARRKMAAGDLRGALEDTTVALSSAPTLELAQRMRDDLEDAIQVSETSRKKREPPPAEMARPIAFYKDEDVAQAIDAAEAIGGPVAATYSARMRQMTRLLEEVDAAHKAKAAAELLRTIPGALDLDLQIAGGEGKIRTKLRRFYADGYYLKAIEAIDQKDYVRSYQLLTESLRQQPGHALSVGRLAELGRKARDLYFEGTEKKSSDPAEARRIFKRLTQMTPPSNQYHKAASKWLASNGG